MSRTQQIRMPDLVADLAPLEGALNPYHDALAPEARAWFSSFHLFPTDKQNSHFSQSRHELLASYAYPGAGPEQLRIAFDLTNILFGFDDFTDQQNEKDASHTLSCFSEVMKDPAWGDDYVVTRITRDFRIRLGRLAGPNNLRRIVRLSEDWAQGILEESKLRDAGTEVLSEDEYLPLRQSTGAMRLVLALTECCLGIDLPDEAHENPVLLKAHYAVVDHVCWSNDVVSYHREQAKGHTTNFVAVAMKHRNLSLQEAYDYVGVRCRQRVEDYVSARDEFRATVGQGDALRYVEALGDWLTGNTLWAFRTVRYFGHEVEEVARSLIVTVEHGGVDDGSRMNNDLKLEQKKPASPCRQKLLAYQTKLI